MLTLLVSTFQLISRRMYVHVCYISYQFLLDSTDRVIRWCSYCGKLPWSLYQRPGVRWHRLYLRMAFELDIWVTLWSCNEINETKTFHNGFSWRVYNRQPTSKQDQQHEKCALRDFTKCVSFRIGDRCLCRAGFWLNHQIYSHGRNELDRKKIHSTNTKH